MRDLLRHHDETEGYVHWSETLVRDGFDYVLSYYGLVEIAALTGLMPKPLPAKFCVPALRLLSHPAVKKYYEKNYPLLLPRLLRYRLEGRNDSQVPPRAENPSLFALFLEISKPIDFDANVETFLWFLDDGLRGGYDISHVNRTLRSFKAFALRMSKTRRPSPADRAVQGLVEYMRICLSLSRLLHDTEEPLLRSAFWHWHAYWFGALKTNVQSNLSYALERFAAWETGSSKASTEHQKELAAAARESRATLSLAIRELTGTKYGRELRAHAKAMQHRSAIA
ncbi:MAG: hypothetical protein AB1762_20675 [Gemmatimonadota bacterium]